MLRAIADGLWVYDMPLSFGPLHVGARMTVLRLSTGELALVSPVKFDAPVRDAIAALGNVRFVVAPNLMHYKYVPLAKELFPQATVLGAPGLKAKKPELPIDAELDGKSAFEQDPAIAAELVAGMPGLNEIAILHRPSGTLVLTDVLFFFQESESWATRTLLKVMGGWGRPVQLGMMRGGVKDKAAMKASREKLLGWSFDRLVVTHKDIVDGGAKEQVRAGLAWLG